MTRYWCHALRLVVTPASDPTIFWFRLIDLLWCHYFSLSIGTCRHGFHVNSITGTASRLRYKRHFRALPHKITRHNGIPQMHRGQSSTSHASRSNAIRVPISCIVDSIIVIYIVCNAEQHSMDASQYCRVIDWYICHHTVSPTADRAFIRHTTAFLYTFHCFDVSFLSNSSSYI